MDFNTIHIFSNHERARMAYLKVKEHTKGECRDSSLRIRNANRITIFIGADQLQSLRGYIIDRVVIEEAANMKDFNDIILPAMLAGKRETVYGF